MREGLCQAPAANFFLQFGETFTFEVFAIPLVAILYITLVHFIASKENLHFFFCVIESSMFFDVVRVSADVSKNTFSRCSTAFTTSRLHAIFNTELAIALFVGNGL